MRGRRGYKAPNGECGAEDGCADRLRVAGSGQGTEVPVAAGRLLVERAWRSGSGP